LREDLENKKYLIDEFFPGRQVAAIMTDAAYSDKVANQNLSFLRTNQAFKRCMDIAYKKWMWVEKKLK
jgi:hypothetical protein